MEINQYDEHTSSNKIKTWTNLHIGSLFPKQTNIQSIMNITLYNYIKRTLIQISPRVL